MEDASGLHTGKELNAQIFAPQSSGTNSRIEASLLGLLRRKIERAARGESRVCQSSTEADKIIEISDVDP
jgi:hypothetical protein